MAHVYAFDNRDGSINSAVRLHKPRKAPASGLEAWTRHPRITVAPGVRAAATQPTPATWGQIDPRSGRRVPTYAELALMDAQLKRPCDRDLAMAAQELAETGGGVYECLMRWTHEHRA
jgi:hypothetical protein